MGAGSVMPPFPVEQMFPPQCLRLERHWRSV